MRRLQITDCKMQLQISGEWGSNGCLQSRTINRRERAVNKRFLPPFFPPTSNQWLLATHCFGRLIGYDGGMAIEPRKYRTNYWLLAIAWASIFIVLSFSHRICDGKGVPSAETVTAVVSNLAGHNTEPHTKWKMP